MKGLLICVLLVCVVTCDARFGRLFRWLPKKETVKKRGFQGLNTFLMVDYGEWKIYSTVVRSNYDDIAIRMRGRLYINCSKTVLRMSFFNVTFINTESKNVSLVENCSLLCVNVR